jgi:hypothetical protein
VARPRVRKNTLFTEIYYEDVTRGTSWSTVKRERPATPEVRKILEKALDLYIADKIEPEEVHNDQSCFHEGIITFMKRRVTKDKKVHYDKKERDVEKTDINTVKLIPRDPWENRDHHVIRMFARDGSRADFPIPKGCKIPDDASEVAEATA